MGEVSVSLPIHLIEVFATHVKNYSPEILMASRARLLASVISRLEPAALGWTAVMSPDRPMPCASLESDIWKEQFAREGKKIFLYKILVHFNTHNINLKLLTTFVLLQSLISYNTDHYAIKSS